MAELETGAEPDIDGMDDNAFAALKTEMRKGASEPSPEAKPDKAAQEPPKTQNAAPEPDLAAADDENPDPKAETVPHGQFHRERERRKAAEAERQTIADNYAKLLERTNQLLEVSRPAPEPQQPEIPQWAQDPMGAGQWTQAELLAVKERLAKEDAARAEAEQTRAAERAFNAKVDGHVRAFVAKTPDYPAAFQFAAISRDQELALAYPFMTEQQRYEHLQAEYKAMFHGHMEAGNNPAEKLYEFAKLRGYKPGGAQAETKNPAAELARQEELRLASQSLGKGGGAVADTGRITPEQLVEMSDEEFAAYKKKHGSVAHAFRA